MLILKQNSANSVPVPPAGKGTIFLDDSDTLSVKTSDGNVETFPTVAASNAQVVYMNGTSLSGEAAFTYDFNNNVLNVTGNIAVGNVLTDNLKYANGVPWDLSDPGGSNTQIQFNDDESFGGSAAFTFNKTSNVVTMSGNANIGNIGTAQVLASANVTAPQLISNVSTGTAPLVVTSTTQVANLNVANAGHASTANTIVDSSQPNITSVGTLTSVSVTGNATAGNVYANSGTIGANLLTGTLTTASNAQPNITSVGTLAGLTVSGHIIPNANISYDLGNATNAFRDLYLDGNSIKLGGATIRANATAIILQNPIGGQVVVSGNSVASASEIINGTSNVSIPSANGNILLSVAGNANILTVTGTGVNVAGTLNTGSGNANVGNIGATQGVFTNVSGNGSALSSITGANVTGEVSFAATANAVAGANVSGQVGNALVAGTVYTAAQPNITSVGTLTSLAVTGNATAGNVYANSGTIGASLLTGTLTTASQPNITSVGTLSSLTVTGKVTAGQLQGDGGNISNIQGANVSGTVGSATTAGTVTTAAQPNITSVGTLTSLGVSGNITAANITANTGVFTGNGSGLSALAGANVTGQVANALVAGTVYTNAQPNITSVGTLNGLTLGANLAMGGFNITGLATPNNSTDAATKQYVDDVAQGLNVHDSCGAATPDILANVTGGTITYNNGTSGVNANLVTTGSFNLIDGVNVQTSGTRILVKNEANAAHNGIYTWANSTTIVRATDFNSVPEVEAGDFTFVTAGTLYDNTGWVQTSAVTTIGTDPIEFTQFSGAGTYQAGTGLTLLGSTFSVNASQTQVTSVGTLTGLSVNGNITAANITANTGVFTGNGSGLSAIAGANVTGQVSFAATANAVAGANVSGQVANALVSGTVYTNAQPNITSVGTLTSLSVTGNANVGNIGATNGVFTNVSGNGSALTELTGANVTGQVGNALVAGTVYTAAQPNITSVGTLSSVAVTGNANVGNLNAATAVIASTLTSNVATGTAPLTVTSTTRVANLNVAYANVADNINVTTQSSGNAYLIFANALTGNVAETANASFVANTSNGALYATTFIGAHDGNGAALTTLNASNISSGTLAQARLANASLTLGNTSLTLGGTTTTVAGLTSVTSTTFVGALTGAATTAGTVTTAAQPNITSVGTLSGLTVSATISGSVSGTAATVTTAAQPNITSVGTLTGLTLANAAVLSWGSNTNVGTITGNISLSAGSRLQATYADLAEKYAGDASYEVGTVLVFGGDHEVTIARDYDSHRVAGVVSDSAAYIMNSGIVADHPITLALQGRVPVKVHGPVAKGDLMVSGPNGHAVANNMARAGTILGKALENFAGSNGVIEVVVGRV
jgi:hypothetical protein